jgi:DNA-binding LacI/PurR family transcriptional regulator
MEKRLKLYDFQVTQVAARGTVNAKTVRNFLADPTRMKAATRSRVETALRDLGFLPAAEAHAKRGGP